MKVNSPPWSLNWINPKLIRFQCDIIRIIWTYFTKSVLILAQRYVLSMEVRHSLLHKLLYGVLCSCNRCLLCKRISLNRRSLIWYDVRVCSLWRAKRVNRIVRHNVNTPLRPDLSLWRELNIIGVIWISLRYWNWSANVRLLWRPRIVRLLSLLLWH